MFRLRIFSIQCTMSHRPNCAYKALVLNLITFENQMTSHSIYGFRKTTNTIFLIYIYDICQREKLRCSNCIHSVTTVHNNHYSRLLMNFACNMSNDGDGDAIENFYYVQKKMRSNEFDSN